ncbi:hypothetical protein [Neobacillus terrae]|uniref:hypothetical protein n=1 Tax=Neobacillus terrae TaxID=3034837 RepID=UPI00140A63AC|nr:hypothetical protein [Neobacillus terrae]NHM32393.1 hypothetical protein [Neobacillus terrae]
MAVIKNANQGYSKEEVLRSLEEDIAKCKKKIDETVHDATLTDMTKSLSQNLTSYEIVANSKQVNYPVIDSEALHNYLMNYDLKKPISEGNYYNVISFEE